MKRKSIKIISILILLLYSPVRLSALPQELEVFTDFEDISGEGEFFIGEEPNRIKLVGFTVETLEDPALLHSGTKAITLGPGQEGVIVSERGIDEIQFYAAENTGAGRIEPRGNKVDLELFIIIVLAENGIVEGLPTNISPSANPPLQSFVSDSDMFLDSTDFDFLDGIKELKIKNVSGKFSLDDLGFTITKRPSNNTVFTTFEDFSVGAGITAPIIVGESPISATFDGGSIVSAANNPTRSGTVSYGISNGESFTVTFETPAFEIDVFAAAIVLTGTTDPDGTIEVYDTNDNLLATFSDLESAGALDALFKPRQTTINTVELGAPGGIDRLIVKDNPNVNIARSATVFDDFGFTPIGAPGTNTSAPPPADAPSITTQPTNQEVQSGTAVVLSVAASGDDLTYQWYTGNSGDTASPVAGATAGTLDTGALSVSTSFWVQITNTGGTANSETAVITVAAPSVPLVLDGSGDIAGENIQHANGNVFDQILLTGESVQLQAKPGQITRVSFMDETEDIVQVEFSGNGTFTVTLDPATFLPPAIPPRYNQAVEYVTGKPSVVIDGADANTFFSIFTVGRINAFNQALFPEGQVYDAQADVSLVEVVNSTELGGVQLSNTVFSGSTGRVGVDARGVPIAVRLTIGDIDASGDAVPHILFGSGSFTVPAGNPGLRITGGDLLQTNGAAVVVAESGSTTTGFDTLITQNNFKSDNTPQPTQSINATFANEDGDDITVTTEEITIE